MSLLFRQEPPATIAPVRPDSAGDSQICARQSDRINLCSKRSIKGSLREHYNTFFNWTNGSA